MNPKTDSNSRNISYSQSTCLIGRAAVQMTHSKFVRHYHFCHLLVSYEFCFLLRNTSLLFETFMKRLPLKTNLRCCEPRNMVWKRGITAGK
jgi:hypothetical protein